MHYIDQALMLRFAEWLIAREPTNAAITLLKSVQSKSPIIGARIKGAILSADADVRAAIQGAFTVEECQLILGPMGADPKDISWDQSQSANRQRRRAAALDGIAQGLGYDSWRKLETDAINERIKIRIDS